MSLIPNPWVLLAFVLALVGVRWYSLDEGEDLGSAKVQQAWDNAQRIATENRAKRIESNRKAEQALQAAADKERKESDVLSKKRDADLRTALLELRNRPARPSGPVAGELPTPAGAGPKGGGATGADLYRDDAEFLTGKADLAQRIRDQRDTCYRLYNAAREMKADAQ